MVLADGSGLPLGGYLCSATPAEVTLVEDTLKVMCAKKRPKRLIADRAYDSQKLRDYLASNRIELIAPHKKNRKSPPAQDGRKLRRYRNRWKVERTIAWIGNYRRVAIRWDRSITIYRAFVHIACLLILIRHL